mgnify:CR=1 FL=1|jgi:ATP-dependent helicase/nuclease subunit A
MSDDRAARLRALEPNSSFAVRAPAGSGKTTLLTQRLLRLLTCVEHPEQIVAITFTRKAAEEMRTRVIEALEGAREVPPADPFARQTWDLAHAALAQDVHNDWKLAEHPARLRIMTIDALCQGLVRQMPITAGMPGLPAVEDDLRQLYREAARDTLATIAHTGTQRRAIAQVLQHVDNDWIKLEALVAEMLQKRDQWLPLLGAGSDREVLEESYARTARDELRNMLACLPDEWVAEMAALGWYAVGHLDTGLEITGDIPPPEFESLPFWKHCAGLFLTKDSAWRKRIDKRSGFPTGDDHAKAMKKRWTEFSESLVDKPELQARMGRVQQLPVEPFGTGEWEIVSALIALLKSATAHLMVLCEQSGRSDFTAFSMSALVALGEPEQPTDLALGLDYQIRHLLIDEFQDTSHTQFQLVERLTAGWSPGDGRTLFLVGDPMQSIYRFRQADVSLFRRVLDDAVIGNVAVEALTLTANFRSQSRLVEWVNEAMPAALARVAASDAHFVPQLATRSAAAEPCVLHAFGEFDAAREAGEVCDIVATIRRTNPDASIAVLVRSRTHLGDITRALLAAQMAVSAREIQPFRELEVIADLMALARALLHRADRTAWFALLRAPWCGLRLDTLHRLAELAPTLVDGLALAAQDETFSDEERARIERTRAILRTALAQQKISSFALVLEQAWLALGGPALAGDMQAINDARSFFDTLAELEGEGIVLTSERIANRFAERFSAPPAGDSAAVQIMTIHRAKGLEFDHVIIPGLGRQPRGDSRSLLLWREGLDDGGEPTLLLAPIPTKGNSLLYDYLRSRDHDEAQAEVVRLLYVGLTRARYQVHLLAHATPDNKDELQPAKGGFLSLLWPVLEAHFSAVRLPDGATSGAVPAGPRLRRAYLSSLQELAAPGLGHGMQAPPTVIEFDWAGVTAKHVGTVTHRLLQDLATGSASASQSRWLERALAFGRGQLRALGVLEQELPGALDLLDQALTTTLASERGRWLFAADHQHAEAELTLVTVEQANLGRIVIDRTFIDEQQRRWIIDFKTGAHTGGGLDAYLDAEVVRYRAQLERYARAMAALDSRPVMLGLYFPLLDGWREWPYPTAATHTDGSHDNRSE